ncbi:MAG: alpha/beta hydrolase fold domain-containing protein [Acidimicrobiales bacterium]
MTTSARPSRPAPVAVDRLVIEPTPDPRLAGILEMIRNLPAAGKLDEKRRRVLGDVERDADWLADNGYVTEWVDAGGVAAQFIEPPGPQGDGMLVTFHGGGFVLCSAGTHARRFAVAGGLARCRVLNVEYRLAPEHPFPAGLLDAMAAARWAAERGPFVLAGDSAGGCLALSAAVALRDEQGSGSGAVPAGVVALSPWTDLTNAGGSRTMRLERDPFAHVDDLDGYASMYLGSALRTDPRASPLYAELAGLPPVLIQVGSEETAFDDAARFADASAAAGVATRLEGWTGMFHTWHTYVGRLKGADEATDAYAAWVSRRLRP